MNACTHCNGTGEVGQQGFLDCVHCDAATERAALNAFVDSLKHATHYDIHWAIHQRAMAIAQARMDAQTIVVGLPRRRATDFPAQD